MKKLSVWLVSAVCVFLLLVVAISLIANSPLDFPFLASDWASQPSWSPSGEEIVFICHRPSLTQVWEDKGKSLFHWGFIPDATEICVADVESGDVTRLTENSVGDTNPVWSPDGQFTAHKVTFGEGNAITIVDRNGTEVRMFTTDLDIWSAQDLAWSPDGKKLCFAARSAPQHTHDINLYLADIDKELIEPLTTLPGDELECQWSSDGIVAFVSYPDGFKWLLSEEANIQIAGEGNSYTAVEGFAGIGDLAWSPDGTQIAFWAYQSPDCTYDCAGIYVIDLVDGSIEHLTKEYEISVLFEAAWSPDGKLIAFTGQSSTGPGIYTITPNGKELLEIAPLIATSDHDLAWSPDQGSIILVHGVEGDTSEIWLVDTETGELEKLDTR